jgi:type I restriction enzyme M protein
MPPRSKDKPAKEAPARSLEAQLWDAANGMRGAVSPSDYMHVALGLVFLRYLSIAFETMKMTLCETPHADTEDADEYQFWVPPEARWSRIADAARSPDIGKQLDDAMRALERDNEDLKGILPKIYGSQYFSPMMLGKLIDIFTNLNLKGKQEDFDLLGRVYEFFLGEFSALQGKGGGEQYTPRCVVSTLVEMIEPLQGRVYDPCCGTGGFYIMSERFIKAHAGRIGDIAIYGQERNPETYRLARMNLAIRNISGVLRWNAEGTLLKDAFPDMRFSSILANPPFNISDWSGELLRSDARWKFGVPPVGNANFAWLQHIYSHLTPDGFGGVVLANGSMSSNSGGEGEIRKAMIEGDAVDCMVSLPNQLFFGTQIPVCLWILARNKGGGDNGSRTLRNRKGEILFLDARKLGHMVSRTNKELSSEDVQKLAGTYHAWREGRDYQDIAGFCKSATLDEVRAHGHVLTPGRYVGAEGVEDDGEPFEEKMPRLVAELNAQFAESAKLEQQIKANFKGLALGGCS